MLTAITRGVSRSINRCELSFRPRLPIDFDKATAQHQAYEDRLRRLGAEVVSLPAEHHLPDAVFVEDPAVVLDEVAIISRTGAESRRPEAASLASALSRYRRLEYLVEPATLEGGDVMLVGRTLLVGASRRTNRAGRDQLNAIVSAYGYQLKPIEVTGCLHLKSACSYIGGSAILVNRARIDTAQLEGFQLIDVPDLEPGAANAMLVGETVVVPESFPLTRDLLERRGFQVQTVDVSELQKAEAGVSCMSLIFE